MDTPVSVGSRPAVPGAPRVYDMVMSITFGVGSAKSNCCELFYYEVIWCFQDERVHTVLPDCLSDAMLSLGPEDLQPLAKGTFIVFGTVPRSQAQPPSRQRCRDSFKYSRIARISPRRVPQAVAVGAEWGSGHSGPRGL